MSTTRTGMYGSAALASSVEGRTNCPSNAAQSFHGSQRNATIRGLPLRAASLRAAARSSPHRNGLGSDPAGPANIARSKIHRARIGPV